MVVMVIFVMVVLMLMLVMFVMVVMVRRSWLFNSIGMVFGRGFYSTDIHLISFALCRKK